MTEADILKLYPNMPKRGQRKGFFAAIGRGIATWQMVESGLYEVYRASTVSHRPGAEAMAFFALHAFANKLALTNGAVQFVLHKNPLLKRWVNLRNRADKLSDHRNAMAHYGVTVWFNEPKKHLRIQLSRNVYDPSGSLQDSRGEPYTAKRLREYEKKFYALGNELRDFSRSIPAVEPPRQPE